MPHTEASRKAVTQVAVEAVKGVILAMTKPKKVAEQLEKNV